MQLLTENCDMEQFWRRLGDAPQAILLLDFDGTLAPFVSDPSLARPYPEVEPLLQQLAALAHNRLVLVSGRELSSLEACLDVHPLPELWGCHGWQRRRSDGQIVQQRLAGSAAELLERAAELVMSAGFAAQLERKPASVALHWRGQDAETTAYLRDCLADQWRQLCVGSDLQPQPFDGGLELRCPGVGKGTVVEQLLSEAPTGSVLAYLGDDLTDEDAFTALAGRGLRVLVRPHWRATVADLWLQPPDELLWFLRRWYQQREGVAG